MRKTYSRSRSLIGDSFGNEWRPRCPEARKELRSDVSWWIKQRARRDSSPGACSCGFHKRKRTRREEFLFPETQLAIICTPPIT